MKNKLYISFLLFIICTLSINAQSDYYYYYKGQKTYLELDKSSINILTNNNFTISETTEVGLKPYSLGQDNETATNKFGKVEYQTEPTLIEFYQKINLLKSKPNIKSIGLFFKRNGATSIGISNCFYVKLKSENDFNILQQLATQKNVKIVKQVPNMPFWYILSATNTQFSSLELSNQFYESGLFADIDPAFMFHFTNGCTNDPEFGNLWGLNNTANPAIDINACQAWNVTLGQNIKVAVLDNGIFTTHNDLATNISPLSFNTLTGTSPSVFNGSAHGTHIAGTIGAIKDNNLQVVGVAPACEIMSVSHPLNVTQTISAELASGISWANQNNARVINNSWGDSGGFFPQLHSTILENAIDVAINNEMLVVFCSHNNNGPVVYPANYDSRILAVGSITSTGQRSSFSNYGTPLDVVAPGSNILSTMPNNSIGNMSGTSMATPHVVGVCALVLSVNPCLTAQQVRDIIEKTSQKIGGYTYTITAGRPNGTWNNEMGYGLVDAYAAVQMAQQMYSATLDLMVKDGTDDIGNEPNNITPYMWASSDIWIRNQADGIINQEHQNPEYSPTVPNFAYVRVTNKSCVASNGNEQIKFYWAKAGTSLEWPASWDGLNYFPSPIPSPLPNVKLGDQVGTVTIPTLQPGQETIVQIPFMVPNPSDYSFWGADQWHFCLLARIEATNDPLNETNGLYSNVQNNNGIAWKNVTIVDLLANRNSGFVTVGNPFDEPRAFFLELVKEDLETGKPIYDEAEVSVKMDETLFNAWERGGKIAQELEATQDQKRKIVKGNNVIIDNIAFNANEMGSVELKFNFLTEELTEKSKFVYHVVQRDATTGQIIGGETYIIKKQVRPAFLADAGDTKDVDKNEPITISASQISEPAIYNWYDSAGNLVFTGKDLTIATQVATKYKLEVIATTDGFKDYSEVDVNIKPSILNTIAPNPATNNVNISYKLNEAGSAYLMIIGSYGTTGTTNNYILDINSSEAIINISNYPNGFYTVALVCNGNIVDAKTLIKQ
ncbi:S8 family serine peptidase [Flavobacterium sp.]|uniref:S8 family serine peptidase n=1 Tax=Flavobacterium sp. TaxID=239 RepID=UPI0025E2AD5A|nr:S8 family serine peptidase [Flavobacterium sp.]